MLKPITGTWFEFQHHNIPEGKYWNPICRWFTDEQWEAKVDEIAELGMKYIVLLTTAQVYDDRAFSYFKTDIYKAKMIPSTIKRYRFTYIGEVRKIEFYTFEDEKLAAMRSCGKRLSGWHLDNEKMLRKLESIKATTVKL